MAKLTVLYGLISQKQIVPTIIILCVVFFPTMSFFKKCSSFSFKHHLVLVVVVDAAVPYHTTLG